MTQGIVGWRRENWPGEAAAQNEEPPWAPAVAPRPPDPFIEHPLSILTPPMPRFAVAPTAPATTPAARDAQVQARLDAFLLAMSTAYRTPSGTIVSGTTFQMSVLYANQRDDVRANQGALVQGAIQANLTREDFARVRAGRGTPGSIHALTQALIDRHALPKATIQNDLSMDGFVSQIRFMMFQFGIGIDCAGYVQQAYLHAMRIDAATAHFMGPTFEDLSNLGSRGYRRIDDLAAVRPGDLVVLGPPTGQPGHRAIVYEQHPATADDLESLETNGTEALAFAQAGPLRVFQVDSSWGCSGDPRIGGVRRETWWYSSTTKKWAWVEQGLPGQRPFATGDTPLNHPFSGTSGIFRAAGRP
jgi:cell wall-associated NlpC family hydrolase